MNNQAAKQLLKETFDFPFDIGKYKTLSRNIFKNFEEAEFSRHGQYIPEAFRSHISTYKRLGKYEDNDSREIDILIVYLKEGISLDRARTLQRNFISNYLDDKGRDAALVAFTSNTIEDWRFSLVTLDFKTIQGKGGKVEVVKELSSAKRFSFLVGKNEANHTAQQQVLPLLTSSSEPSIQDLETVFSVEQVTDEFYREYKSRFEELDYEIKRILQNDDKIRLEFENENIRSDHFAKKLMGQIVFLYFVQKKGWLGVGKGKDGNFLSWGAGDKKFMRNLFEGKYVQYDNYFNDVLEPLFYEALATERPNNFYSNFNCKIPFLSGGLFEPINGYNWQETDITISNTVLKLILDTFDRYNFTVKEDDPLDKEVAIDPEMLGKVFENLLPENLRKGNGAYYTPRSIVHYMCQESLINYLDTHLNDTANKDITKFIKEGEELIDHDKIAQIKKEGYKGKYESKMPPTIVENAKEIDELLVNVKICDPAIGSGAFPMGLLHEIVVARNILTTYIGNKEVRTKYQLKRDSIQNSIYGVDLDGGAIEIAKLRLWLSLLVDEDDIEQIKPLPNLEYKLMQGNSLIEDFHGITLDIDETDSLDLFNEESEKIKLIKELKDLQDKFFNAKHKSDKQSLKEKVENLKIKIFHNELEEKKQGYFNELKKIEDITKAIPNIELRKSDLERRKRELDKKRNFDFEAVEDELRMMSEGKKDRSFFPWKLDFSDVFKEGGFDIVIANPPYIKEYTNRDAFNGFRNSLYYKGKMDLWYGFACISLDLLKEHGVQCFIAQNNWVTSAGASVFRKKVLEETKIKVFTDFCNYKVFDTAGIQTMIYLLKKEKTLEHYNLKYSLLKKDSINEIELENFLNFNYDFEINEKYILNFNNSLYYDSYISFNNSKINKVLDSIIDNDITHLENNEIAQGIVFPQDKLNKKSVKKLGDDFNKNEGVFQINNQELQNMTLESNELNLIKPYYTTSQLHKYYGNIENKEWIIYTKPEINTKISFFPNIKEHLDKYIEIITSDNKPYGLHRARKEDFFIGEKIISLRKKIQPSFTYTDFDCYVSQTFFSIKTNRINLKYLTVLLNSKIIAFWLRYKGKMQGNNFQIDKQPLLEIPLKKINELIEKNFISLLDKIIEGKKDEEDTTALEHQVDVMVYKIYELNYEEVLIVDEEFTMSKEEYERFQII